MNIPNPPKGYAQANRIPKMWETFARWDATSKTWTAGLRRTNTQDATYAGRTYAYLSSESSS